MKICIKKIYVFKSKGTDIVGRSKKRIKELKKALIEISNEIPCFLIVIIRGQIL